MNLTTHEPNIKTIRPDDKEWLLNDGWMVSPRAGLEISDECPHEYKLMLYQAINKGWIRPIAYVYGKTLTMDALR